MLDEIEGLRKIQGENAPESTTRLRYMIVEVDGSRDRKDIKDFIDNYFLARDARAFREYYAQVQPDIDLTAKIDVNGVEEEVEIPIGITFFWPDAE